MAQPAITSNVVDFRRPQSPRWVPYHNGQRTGFLERLEEGYDLTNTRESSVRSDREVMLHVVARFFGLDLDKCVLSGYRENCPTDSKREHIGFQVSVRGDCGEWVRSITFESYVAGHLCIEPAEGCKFSDFVTMDCVADAENHCRAWRGYSPCYPVVTECVVHLNGRIILDVLPCL